MRMLLIDNYDSFTYNLVQAFAALGAEVIVHRNDAITVDEALAIHANAPGYFARPGPTRGRRRVVANDCGIRRIRAHYWECVLDTSAW